MRFNEEIYSEEFKFTKMLDSLIENTLYKKIKPKMIGIENERIDINLNIELWNLEKANINT